MTVLPKESRAPLALSHPPRDEIHLSARFSNILVSSEALSKEGFKLRWMQTNQRSPCSATKEIKGLGDQEKKNKPLIWKKKR